MRAVQQDVDSALRNLCTTHQCEPSRPPAQSTLVRGAQSSQAWICLLLQRAGSGLWKVDSGAAKAIPMCHRAVLCCFMSPELAELVDDGGFVLQGVRIATWKSSSS